MFLYLAWSSHGLFAAQYGFVQQSTGMLFLLGSTCMPDDLTARRRALFIVLSLLACIHKSSAILLVLVLLFRDVPARLKRAILVVSVLAFAILSFRHFPDVQRYLTMRNAAGFVDYYRSRSVAPQPVFEGFLFGALTIAMAANAVIRKNWLVLLLCGLIACLNLPFWGHDNTRYFQTSIWIFFLALCESLRHDQRPWFRHAIATAVVVCSAAKIAMPPGVQVRGAKLDPSRMAEHSALLTKLIPKDALVVAPPGVEYQVQYFLQRRTGLNPPASTRKGMWVIKEKDAEGAGCVRLWDGQRVEGVASCVELDPMWIVVRRDASITATL
jgi:hypothetical protein